MKNFLLLGPLYLTITMVHIKAQLSNQNECSEYQKVVDGLIDIDLRLARESALFTDEHPVIKELQQKHEKLLLMHKKFPRYLFKKCMAPKSTTSEPVMGLW